MESHQHGGIANWVWSPCWSETSTPPISASYYVICIGEVGAGAGTLRVHVIDASGLRAAASDVTNKVTGTSDPFVRVRVGGTSKDSHVEKRTLKPIWEQDLEFEGQLETFVASGIHLEVFDYDKLRDRQGDSIRVTTSLCTANASANAYTPAGVRARS